MPMDTALEAGRGRPNSVTSCNLMLSVAKAGFVDFLTEETLEWGGVVTSVKSDNFNFSLFCSAYVCIRRHFLLCVYIWDHNFYVKSESTLRHSIPMEQHCAGCGKIHFTQGEREV